MQLVVDPVGSVYEAIIFAVSESEDRPPTSLPPLHDAVDPDALETLCTRRPDGTAARNCTISFTYSDSQVVVNAGQMFTISVTDRRDGSNGRRDRTTSFE